MTSKVYVLTTAVVMCGAPILFMLFFYWEIYKVATTTTNAINRRLQFVNNMHFHPRVGLSVDKKLDSIIIDTTMSNQSLGSRQFSSSESEFPVSKQLL